MIRYIVRPPYIGPRPTIEISRERYDSILAAHEHLLAMSSVEQKYDILIENFRELEMDMLEIALNDQLYAEFSVVGFTSIHRQIARRLANLLSGARLYLDYLGREDESGHEEWYPDIHREMHDLYDREPDYRLLESLRNYVQHRGLPFSFSRPSNRIDAQDRTFFSFHTAVSLQVSEFLQDDKIKPVIREDLQSSPDTLALDLPIRHYVALLFGLQQRIREMTARKTDDSEALLLQVTAEYSAVDQHFGQSEQKVLALHEWEDGQRLPSSTREISTNAIMNLDYLRQKNRVLTNLPKWYVSGQADSDLKFLREVLSRQRKTTT